MDFDKGQERVWSFRCSGGQVDGVLAIIGVLSGFLLRWWCYISVLFTIVQTAQDSARHLFFWVKCTWLCAYDAAMGPYPPSLHTHWLGLTRFISQRVLSRCEITPDDAVFMVRMDRYTYTYRYEYRYRYRYRYRYKYRYIYTYTHPQQGRYRPARGFGRQVQPPNTATVYAHPWTSHPDTHSHYIYGSDSKLIKHSFKIHTQTLRPPAPSHSTGCGLWTTRTRGLASRTWPRWRSIDRMACGYFLTWRHVQFHSRTDGSALTVSLRTPVLWFAATIPLIHTHVHTKRHPPHAHAHT